MTGVLDPCGIFLIDKSDWEAEYPLLHPGYGVYLALDRGRSVAYLPLDHKHLIQTSYVRFRELAKEAPEVDRLLTLGKVVHWGGLAVLALFVIRAFVGHDELADWLGGLAILAFIFGWAYESDQRKKQQSLWQEQQQIHKQMKDLGVHFSDISGSVTVYAGHIAEENAVSPLHDGAYK